MTKQYFSALAVGMTAFHLLGVRPLCSPKQVQPRARAVNTLLVHRWATKYGCPLSAKRLSPIAVYPASEFNLTEACALAWRARDAWFRAALSTHSSALTDTASTRTITIVFMRIQQGAYNAGQAVPVPQAVRPAVIVSFTREQQPAIEVSVALTDSMVGPVLIGHPGLYSARPPTDSR